MNSSCCTLCCKEIKYQSDPSERNRNVYWYDESDNTYLRFQCPTLLCELCDSQAEKSDRYLLLDKVGRLHLLTEGLNPRQIFTDFVCLVCEFPKCYSCQNIPFLLDRNVKGMITALISKKEG
jgi:hypothetical protein